MFRLYGMGVIRAVFLLLLSVNAIANDSNLPDLPEPFRPEIPFSRMWDELMEGNFEHAWNLLKKETYRRAKEAWDDEETWARAAEWAGEELDKHLNAESKTDLEKGADIANMIAATVEPYSASEYGPLGVKIEHSIMFETTFISWNDLIKTDECEYFYWKRICEGNECWNEWTAGQDYLVQVPDYSVYRVVNGVDTLVTKIKGIKKITKNRLTIDANDFGWKDTLSDLRKYKKAHDDFYSAFDAESNRIVFMDFKAGARSQGETLSYKIIADNGSYKGRYCGHSNRWEAFVNADSDADRKMDYIPADVYGSIWIRQRSL